MKITEHIETGQEFLWKRTKSWEFNGQERCWEIFVRFEGLNGTGGAWITELWRWNNSQQIIREQPKSLSIQETDTLIKELQ